MRSWDTFVTKTAKPKNNQKKKVHKFKDMEDIVGTSNHVSCESNKVLFLSGQSGIGKTTLAKLILQQFGFKPTVITPTAARTS